MSADIFASLTTDPVVAQRIDVAVGRLQKDSN